MTALFQDVKEQCSIALHSAPVGRIDQTEILYADDTICMTNTATQMGILVRAIEIEGAKYGLHLNKNKCEHLQFNSIERVIFSDGTLVPTVKEAKYLGCWLNDKGDPLREFRQRRQECLTTWNKLEVYWKHANTPDYKKIQVYDAIIKSKLLYGLDSVSINDTLRRQLDVFQMKGYRRILKLQTTFINKANTNIYVLKKANDCMLLHNPKAMPLHRYSDIYDTRRINLLLKIMHLPHNDPRRKLSFEHNTLIPRTLGKRRVGHPRGKWIETTLQTYWTRLTENSVTWRNRAFDPSDITQVIYMRAAIDNWVRQPPPVPDWWRTMSNVRKEQAKQARAVARRLRQEQTQTDTPQNNTPWRTT